MQGCCSAVKVQAYIKWWCCASTFISPRSPAIWSSSLPCAGTGAYPILQWASSLAENSPSKRKVNTFPQLCCCWFFFALDFFTVQAAPQAFIKLSRTPVSAHPWAVQHWSWGGVLSRKLSSQRNSLKCETSLLQPKSFKLLVTWPPHHEPCHTASCRVVFVLEKQIFQRSGSGNLTVKFRHYGPIGKECQWKLWAFLLKSKHLPWVIT